VGNLTFGGGDPTMAALQRELVERLRWLRSEQYGLAFSLARVTPGTNVLAFCAAAGWMVRGWAGALLAVGAASIPTAIIATWLVAASSTLRSHPLVEAALGGAVAAAIGMMLASAILLLRPFFRDRQAARAIVLAAGAGLATSFGMSPIPVLGMAALVGFFWREARTR
jgi:chromate transporter